MSYTLVIWTTRPKRAFTQITFRYQRTGLFVLSNSDQ